MLFVPQPERQRLKAGKERDRFDLLKKRSGVITFFQIVIWDLGAQMMDVMKPDAAGEPLQNPR